MSTQNNNQQQQGNEADPNEQFGAIVRRISAGLNSLKLAGILGFSNSFQYRRYGYIDHKREDQSKEGIVNRAKKSP